MTEAIVQNNINPTFTTKSNGKKYNFVASFIPLNESTAKTETGIILDNSHIKSFTWVNEINNILLTGELEYLDATGEIGKYFGLYLSYVSIKLSLDTTENFRKSKVTKKEFIHTFIVNNFEIKGRTGSAILYKLYLVSAHWFNYIANINYSNYDKYNNDKTQCDISIIMRDILKSVFSKSNSEKYFITVDEESFTTNATTIQLPYCTTCQTKCIDAIKYLQNHMFYDNRPNSDVIFSKGLNFLVFDEFNNQIKMLNFYDALKDKNILNSDKVGTIISLAGSTTEEYTQLSEQNLRSVVKKSNCQSLQSLFGSKFFKYDITTNTISPFDKLGTNILTEVGISKNLTELKTNETNAIPIVNGDAIINSVASIGNFNRYGSFDNNSFSIYNDLIENLMNRSCLILETAGEISHQPGQIFCIVDDTEAVKQYKDLERKQYKDKNRMLTGVFYIFKVRHTFVPGEKDGSGFTERLFVGRTYNPEIKTTGDNA